MLPINMKALTRWLTGRAIESRAGSERLQHVNHPSCRCPACLIAIQTTNERRAIFLASLAATERGYFHA
jgi:hypothetical protein